MNKTNLDIILTNALCCSSKLATEVSRLLSIGDKCDKSKLIDLKLLNDRINVLQCYKFTTNTIIEYNYIRDIEFISLSTVTYNLYINGISYNLIGDNITTVSKLILDKLKILGFYIDATYTLLSEDIGNLFIFRYYLPCSITSLTLETITPQAFPKPPVTREFIGRVLQQGNCNYENCLTEDQMNNITHKIMSQCNICDCQLKQ